MTYKIEDLRRQYEENREAERKAKAAKNRAVQKAEEAARRAEELEEQAETVRAEARKTAWRPDSDPTVVAAAEQKATGKEGRAEQLRAEAEEAKEAYEAARTQAAQSGRALARAVAKRTADDRVPAKEAALAALADAVLDALPEVLEAEDALADDRGELRRLKRHADGKQEAELRSYLRQAYEDADPRAQMGVLLRDVLAWLRRVDRFAPVFREAGIEPLEGSPRHQDPVPAVEDALNRIEGGKLPDSIGL